MRILQSYEDSERRGSNLFLFDRFIYKKLGLKMECYVFSQKKLIRIFYWLIFHLTNDVNSILFVFHECNRLQQ